MSKTISVRQDSGKSKLIYQRHDKSKGRMKNNERTRTRRERTFVGTECAVCEEPLEHMLSGEKVLQLSCSHVAHGACFYEYMRDSDSQYCPSCHAPLQLDTTRGGNVLDIGELSFRGSFLTKTSG